MYTIIANIVDDGFANKMSIDAIVSYGSFLPIIWTLQSFYNIGKYAYTNTMKHPKTCLFGFATACTVDFGIRAIYFLVTINKCEKAIDKY